MAERMFNVLFLCTGNSARSILAESILRKTARGVSAPSRPEATPRARSIRSRSRCLKVYDYPTDGLRSKSWDEFAVPALPSWISFSRSATPPPRETCPVWPGQPMTAHWGIEDPAAVEGTDIQKEAAFVLATRYLKNSDLDLHRACRSEASTRCR